MPYFTLQLSLHISQDSLRIKVFVVPSCIRTTNRWNLSFVPHSLYLPFSILYWFPTHFSLPAENTYTHSFVVHQIAVATNTTLVCYSTIALSPVFQENRGKVQFMGFRRWSPFHLDVLMPTSSMKLCPRSEPTFIFSSSAILVLWCFFPWIHYNHVRMKIEKGEWVNWLKEYETFFIYRNR